MRNGSTDSAGEMVDTNLLVYAADATAGDRHGACVALIASLQSRQRLVVSTQVLNELYVTLTRVHRGPALTHAQASALVEKVAAAAAVVPLTASVTLRALEGVSQYQLAFWDALIWAAAREAGVTVVHTEDLPSAPVIEGVEFRSPF
jgi:predicted nucleic acid-binding protein